MVQFGQGVWGTVSGLGQLAWSGAKTVYDTNLTGLAVDAYETRTGTEPPGWLPSADRGLGRLEAGKDAVVALGQAVWDDPSILIAEYEALAADGRYGAIVGQAVADFGDLLIGAKGAGKAGQAARLAGRADDLADAAKIAKVADTASELARTARAVPGGADDAADALKATRAALDEIDASALPDEVARKVETARADLDATMQPSRVAPQRASYHRADLADEWYDAKTGDLRWPPNDGFAQGTRHHTTLNPGTMIDRFGRDTGKFTSPEGASYGSRALPYEQAEQAYSRFEVLKPLDVEAGKAARWFGESGGATQYLTADSIENLIKSGHLRRVE